MNNDLAFWGSLRNPNALGKVIRLCLLFKITPVFIPLAEPWRNGIVEHFNDVMQKYILKNEFKNIQDLKFSAQQFEENHNNHHHYSSQQGMTPLKAFTTFNYPFSPLDKSFEMSKDRLPINDGEIHIIRFIRSNLQFQVFGLTFKMPADLKYEYVKGVILTNENEKPDNRV